MKNVFKPLLFAQATLLSLAFFSFAIGNQQDYQETSLRLLVEIAESGTEHGAAIKERLTLKALKADRSIASDHAAVKTFVEIASKQLEFDKEELNSVCKAHRAFLSGFTNNSNADSKLAVELYRSLFGESSVLFKMASINSCRNYRIHYPPDDIDDCISEIEAAVGSDSLFAADANYVRGNYCLTGAFSMAEKSFEKCKYLYRSNSPTVHSRRINLELALGYLYCVSNRQFRKSRNHLVEAEKLIGNSDSLPAERILLHSRNAFLASNQEDDQLALKHLRLGREIAESNPRLNSTATYVVGENYAGLLYTNRALGRQREAIELSTKLIKLRKENPIAEKLDMGDIAYTYFLRSQCYESMGDLENADREVDRALKLCTQYKLEKLAPRALLGSAALANRRGDFAKAIKQLKSGEGILGNENLKTQSNFHRERAISLVNLGSENTESALLAIQDAHRTLVADFLANLIDFSNENATDASDDFYAIRALAFEFCLANSEKDLEKAYLDLAVESKGIATRALSQRHRLLVSATSPKVADLKERYAAAKAELQLEMSKTMDDAVLGPISAKIQIARENLFGQFPAELISGTHVQNNLKRLKSSLPEHATLIDLIRYKRRNVQPESSNSTERYGGLIIKHSDTSEEIQLELIDIADAKHLDQLIAAKNDYVTRQLTNLSLIHI